MILVVGDVMTDVIVRPAAPFQPGSDTPAAITVRSGGSAANIACWIGHLGGAGAARLAARVGAADAAWHTDALRAHGVQPHLAMDVSRETGRAVAILDGAAERSFYADRGANAALCATDLPTTLLDACAALHVSGHTLLGPLAGREAGRALMRAARARGVSVSADAGSAAPLRAAGAEAFRAWTADAACCFCNEAEADILGAATARYPTLVVTRGRRGADVIAGNLRLSATAVAAEALDATGAGDAFTAAALLGIRNGKPPSAWLADAVAAGALAVARLGGRPPERAGGQNSPLNRPPPLDWR